MSLEPFDREEESLYRKIRPYLVISLLVHLLILLLFEKLPGSVAVISPREEAPIWIDLKQKPYQIADIDKPAKEKHPDEARFLGMYDSAVPEEQVAARQGRDKRQSDPQKAQAQKQQERMETKREDPPKTGERFGELPLPAQKKSPPKTLADGTPAAALPDDYYPNYKRGSRTYLNVLRYPDVQYFVMLKRVFKLTFDPTRALREAYAVNQITRGSVETVVGVSIDSGGDLAELFVFKSSGINEYDQEVLRTIRASSPFSTPSGKLLDGEGLIRMSWTFTVYL